MMLCFECDYNNGAHPKILEALADVTLKHPSGYGTDEWSARAKDRIRTACACPGAQITFLSGGTQTNAIVIAAMLKDFEGVVAAKTGHVSIHEAGAIEYTGHKVIELPEKEGKLNPEDVEACFADFYADENHEHMVFPGMVYISYPTEFGTLYTKEELSAIADTAHRYGASLFVDGARLGYGLASRNCDLTLADLAEIADVFYIGGTKVGALCGEAVVFTKGNEPAHFITTVKRRGGLLAKGWLLGLQFDVLFKDNLYGEISRNAILRAEEMKAFLRTAGVKFYLDSPTNQQFVIVPDEKMPGLGEKVRYSFWEKYEEDHTVIRFATSWATTEEEVRELAAVIEEVL